MKRDPSTVNPLLPLPLSDKDGHVTNTNSLLTMEEQRHLEAMLR